MLLIDVAIAVANGAVKQVVRVAESFDKGDGLWSNLGQDDVDGILDESLITTLEIAGVVAGY